MLKYILSPTFLGRYDEQILTILLNLLLFLLLFINAIIPFNYPLSCLFLIVSCIAGVANIANFIIKMSTTYASKSFEATSNSYLTRIHATFITRNVFSYTFINSIATLLSILVILGVIKIYPMYLVFFNLYLLMTMDLKNIPILYLPLIIINYALAMPVLLISPIIGIYRAYKFSANNACDHPQYLFFSFFASFMKLAIMKYIFLPLEIYSEIIVEGAVINKNKSPGNKLYIKQMQLFFTYFFIEKITILVDNSKYFIFNKGDSEGGKTIYYSDRSVFFVQGINKLPSQLNAPDYPNGNANTDVELVHYLNAMQHLNSLICMNKYEITNDDISCIDNVVSIIMNNLQSYRVRRDNTIYHNNRELFNLIADQTLVALPHNINHYITSNTLNNPDAATSDVTYQKLHYLSQKIFQFSMMSCQLNISKDNVNAKKFECQSKKNPISMVVMHKEILLKFYNKTKEHFNGTSPLIKDYLVSLIDELGKSSYKQTVILNANLVYLRSEIACIAFYIYQSTREESCNEGDIAEFIEVCKGCSLDASYFRRMINNHEHTELQDTFIEQLQNQPPAPTV